MLGGFMKKFLITTLAVIIGTTGIMALVQPSNLELAQKNISEVRYNLFRGSSEALSATLMTGEREEDYILNGIAEDLMDFGIITVIFKQPTSELMGSPTYKLTVGDIFYEGELEKSPFDASYVADIEQRVDDDAQVYLLVEWDTLYETIKLDAISPDWELNWEKALEVAMDNIADTNFEELIDGTKLKAEVHIKIISDPQGVTNQYYWYISIYGQGGSVIEIVIDPNTSEIISKRVIQH
jgi:hypothetical protein